MGAKGKDVRLDGLYLGTESWCVSTLMHLDDWLYECFWAVSRVHIPGMYERPWIIWGMRKERKEKSDR